MKRRSFLTGTAGAALMGLSGPALADTMREPANALWQAWKTAHLDFSGRVIDAPQNNASHSEGQGYGMLLAAEFGDADAFRRMADWTHANLAIRTDNLLAWRWLPDTPVRVPDLNNASDGDLFYAWALLRGAERFDTPQWRARAIAVAEDLTRKCIASRPDRPGAPILLPAETGFVMDDAIVFNPSYIMPRALRALSAATGDTQLSRVASSCLDLMAEIARSGLVPDWLQLTVAGPRPAEGFSRHTGYEAIRIPLFLAWSGEYQHPAILRAANAMARAPQGHAGTVIDANTGEILEFSADAGYRAIAAIAGCAAHGGMGAAIPPFARNQPYYPATLHLFTMLAQTEMLPSCRPI
ncbi:glycosyl hydrolase family 8 [Roseinatronobacter alkalisoli]|uniref:cellulase n=1 Tax=Roseinatronobacter alkalisoli TaxID=3028235 RepID=A0ABT5TE10_9RHOB|nr:glycosyl hydrolase family 8 [Roseinatronobacter sp. HJB301]MDD7973363.1 glycosyl hydrolase family 8 [Roseinatronobacter sp. HJB301]